LTTAVLEVTEGHIMVPVESLGIVSWSHFMAVSCIICEIKQEIGRKSPSNYCRTVWCEEKLPDSDKSLMIYLTVSTRYRRVTDGQTDEQTDILHSIVCAIAARSKNWH